MQITLDKNKLTDFTPSGGNTADFQFSLTIAPLGHHGGRLPSDNRRLGAILASTCSQCSWKTSQFHHV
jgi:integrase